MACAINFAFANRQLITHNVREAFSEVFNENDEKMGLDLAYDVAHIIAKFENHFGEELLVHRKGATLHFALVTRQIPIDIWKLGTQQLCREVWGQLHI